MPIFGKKEEKVPLRNDVMMNCICGQCPVQAESACSRPKIEKMMAMRTNMSEKESGMPGSMSFMGDQTKPTDMEPKELPGVYCSIGVSACGDLNNKKACICNQCQVYKDFSLKSARPVEHFCFNGNAI